MSRIVRYPLEFVPYQQVQPLWPGQIFGVGLRQYDERGHELEITKHGLDMWALDNSEHRGDRLPPILGVWIIATGDDIPRDMAAGDPVYHGTIDRRPYLGVHHVFSTMIGYATKPEVEPAPHYGSVDDMAAQIAARHRGGQRG